jgi:hypothetical protein
LPWRQVRTLSAIKDFNSTVTRIWPRNCAETPPTRPSSVQFTRTALDAYKAVFSRRDLLACAVRRSIIFRANLNSYGISCFLITHAHLDHVNSLVISAGSLSGQRKRLCAAKQTLADLESVFADRIWPNLASWNEDDDDHKLLYTMYVAQFFVSPLLLIPLQALA